MRFDDALSEIAAFWTDGPLPLTGGGRAEVGRIQAEYMRRLPGELKEYIAQVLPPQRFALEQYGTYFTLYGFQELSSRQDGYSWNPLKREAIAGWDPTWFLIGDREADPLVVRLGRADTAANPCPVYVAPHAANEWRFKQISSSLPQFLLCAAYLHHALVRLAPCRAIVSKKRLLGPPQVLLADEVAAWLLPRVKRCDEAFYKQWVGVFGNA